MLAIHLNVDVLDFFLLLAPFFYTLESVIILEDQQFLSNSIKERRSKLDFSPMFGPYTGMYCTSLLCLCDFVHQAAAK